MTREEEIIEILKELTEIKSISDTEAECRAQEYMEKRLKGQDYFKEKLNESDRTASGKKFPLTGSFALQEDYLKRKAVYGLVKGNGRKTLILTGHYDVVGVEEFGNMKEEAFSVDNLMEKIKDCGRENGFGEDVLREAESGEWIFGRGTADMKGGLAIGLAILNEYGKKALKEKPEGNLLFLSVPDEESYSSGMRGAIPLLEALREKYDLDYECLIDLEPNFLVDGAQEVFVGSVGKCMPVVLVQGAKAHVGSCFQGLSAAGVLGEIFARTELSPEFAESYEGEVCMPPTWLQLRDMKEEYDVSVPYRAGGYFNMLSFSMTPEEVIGKLEKKAKEAVSFYQDKMERLWKKLMEKKDSDISVPAGAFVPVQIMKYGELVTVCRNKNEREFEKFYHGLYGKTAEKIRSGQWNYPQATMEMMKALLDYSGILSPIILLGFAPPYYPAFHSDMLGKGTTISSKWFELLEKSAEESFGRLLKKKHYFTGISDLSYCGICEENSSSKTLDFYGANAPLWGNLYKIDFEKIAGLNIPSLLFGPLSKDIHQRTERVNKESLTREVPEILSNLIEQMFAK